MAFTIRTEVGITAILALGLISYLPALSVYEFFSTGSIDMEATGSGRGNFKTWKLYLLSWLCFIAIGPRLIVPSVYHFLAGTEISLTADKIIFGDKSRKLTDIESARAHPLSRNITLVFRSGETEVVPAGFPETIERRIRRHLDVEGE